MSKHLKYKKIHIYYLLQITPYKYRISVIGHNFNIVHLELKCFRYGQSTYRIKVLLKFLHFVEKKRKTVLFAKNDFALLLVFSFLSTCPFGYSLKSIFKLSSWHLMFPLFLHRWPYSPAGFFKNSYSCFPTTLMEASTSICRAALGTWSCQPAIQGSSFLKESLGRSDSGASCWPQSSIRKKPTLSTWLKSATFQCDIRITSFSPTAVFSFSVWTRLFSNPFCPAPSVNLHTSLTAVKSQM